jgi:hypothetical protein
MENASSSIVSNALITGAGAQLILGQEKIRFYVLYVGLLDSPE